MKSLSKLTEEEIESVDLIYMEGTLIDEDDLETLIRIATEQELIDAYKYSIDLNDKGGKDLYIW